MLGAGGGGRGAYAAPQFTLLHTKRLNKTESAMFVLLCVFCFQRRPFRFLFYSTVVGVKCRMVAVKRILALHHIVQIIKSAVGAVWRP